MDPGVAIVSEWGPEPGTALPDPALVPCYGLLARKL